MLHWPTAASARGDDQKMVYVRILFGPRFPPPFPILKPSATARFPLVCRWAPQSALGAILPRPTAGRLWWLGSGSRDIYAGTRFLRSSSPLDWLEVLEIPVESHARCIVFADDGNALGVVDLLGGVVREPPPSSSIPRCRPWCRCFGRHLVLAGFSCHLLAIGVSASVVVRRVTPFSASAPSVLSLFIETRKSYAGLVNIRLYVDGGKRIPDAPSSASVCSKGGRRLQYVVVSVLLPPLVPVCVAWQMAKSGTHVATRGGLDAHWLQYAGEYVALIVVVIRLSSFRPLKPASCYVCLLCFLSVVKVLTALCFAVVCNMWSATTSCKGLLRFPYKRGC
jgi:hypothetical protein